MRTITLSYFNEKYDKEYILQVVNNSILSSIFKDEKGIIKIRKNIDEDKWDDLQIKMIEVSFDFNLEQDIVKIIKDSHEKVPQIATSDKNESQNYSIQFPGKIEGIVNSLVNKYCYDTDNPGILEFVSTLLVRIARAHAWYNGNKRTALVSVATLLKHFGYFIAWSNHDDVYIREWESLMYQISGKTDEEDARLGTEEQLITIVKNRLKYSILLHAQKCIII